MPQFEGIFILCCSSEQVLLHLWRYSGPQATRCTAAGAPVCLAFALMTVLQACGNNSKGRVGLPAASSCPHARQCMHSQHCKMYSSNPCETRGRARCPTTCFSILEISPLLLKHAHAAVMLMQRGRGMHHAEPSAVTGNDKVDFIASSHLVKEAMQRTGPILAPVSALQGSPG